MKKTVIFLMAMLLVLSSLTPLQTSAADDLTGYLYEEEMRELIELGVLNGYPDGTFRPNNKVTRAEFAKMVVKSFDLESKVEAAEFTSASTAEIAFTDVPATRWFAIPIHDAVKAGIVEGYPDKTFRPDDLITREQMASMVSRALTAKGIITDMSKVPALSFSDAKTIIISHSEDVRILTHLGIIKGNDDNTFAPKGDSARWMVALLMLRSRDILYPPVPKDFKVSSIKDGKTVVIKEFETFAEAQKFASSNSTAQVVERSHKIVWMKTEGLAVANSFTEVFPSSTLKTNWNTKYRPYVTANAEMKFLSATDKYVKVELAGREGYVPAHTVVLHPKQLLTGQSYYEVTANGSLSHTYYNHNTKRYSAPGPIGKAPAALKAGVKYHSFDGSTFLDANGNKVTEAHQYFNKLPLSTVSSYTAEELDSYFKNAFPYLNKSRYEKTWTSSPLVGTGKFFKEVEAQYKVNALYLVAHAIHESDWGTSLIAQDKYNLFGMQAYDEDAYKNAITYKNYKESIEHVAQHVNESYHNVNGTNYNGSFLGNKALGMNVRYAADDFWGEKIAGHMYRMDAYLGKKDIYKENLGFASFNDMESGLNFRSDAGTANNSLYELKATGIPVVITGQAKDSNGTTWYKVLSEQKQYTDAYVHSAYIKQLPLAK